LGLLIYHSLVMKSVKSFFLVCPLLSLLLLGLSTTGLLAQDNSATAADAETTWSASSQPTTSPTTIPMMRVMKSSRANAGPSGN